MRLRALSFLLIVVLVAASPSLTGTQRAQALTLEQTLDLAGKYVDEYESRLGAISAEEDYRQTAVPTSGPRLSSGAATLTRRTRAYMFSVSLGKLGWVAFRDVFELDGRQVRGRDERLSAILANVTPDSLEQARKIASESARYNLNPRNMRINRTLNVPLAALIYLRPDNQARSEFRLGKIDNINGVTCVALHFRERVQPRLIGTNDDAPAQGTFWIDTAAGGRLVKSQLQIDSAVRREQMLRSQIDVTYSPVGNFDIWLPTRMDESYVFLVGGEQLTAHASYSDFREFKVTTSEDIK
jgi:hypothetical protein